LEVSVERLLAAYNRSIASWRRLLNMIHLRELIVPEENRGWSTLA
jgi:hypothetical protein